MTRLVLWGDSTTEVFKKIVESAVANLDIEIKRTQVYGKLPQLKDDDVCLGFGTKALEVLQEAGLAVKNKGMGSLRETEFPVNNGKAVFLLTFDPSVIMHDYARKPEIQCDVRLAIRRVLTGSLSPNIGKYRYVENLDHVVDFVKSRYEVTKKAVPVAADLETMGLVPYAPEVKIVSLSITYKAGHSDVLYVLDGVIMGVINQIRWLMTTDKVITRWANGKFDKSWMKCLWDIECTNHKFDTMLVGSLLDENRSNTLNLHAKIYTKMGGYDDEFNKTYDKAHMELVPKDDLLPYAGGDTDACYRTATVLRKELVKDKRLTKFYTKLLQPASHVFAKLEHRGMLVNVKEYQRLRVEVAAKVEELEGAAFSMMPRRMRLKYLDNLSLTRDVILREFLFTKRGLNLTPEMFTPKPDKDGNPRPACSIKHLEMFQDVPEAQEFVAILKEHGSAKKTLGTYIDGFLKHLRPDGKFHPTFNLHRGEYEGDGKESGAVTGRTSAKDPAVQTIPEHTIWAKPLKKVYIAPKGMVILNVDFQQGELRICACVANEPTMIEAYKNDIDLHSVTAARLAGYEFEEFMKLPDEQREHYRYGGKAGNFGLIYAMGWAGFQAYARYTYGLILSDEEAQEFREGFFQLYEGLIDWHNQSKDYAHANGFVRSPLGRIRHLPLINTYDNEVRAKQERQAINSPIQSTLSDMAMLAMVELDRQFPELWMFLMTHDNLAMYVPEHKAVEWAVKVKDVMENLPIKQFGWKPQLSFPVDAKVGHNLGELEKVVFMGD